MLTLMRDKNESMYREKREGPCDIGLDRMLLGVKTSYGLSRRVKAMITIYIVCLVYVSLGCNRPMMRHLVSPQNPRGINTHFGCFLVQLFTW